MIPFKVDANVGEDCFSSEPTNQLLFIGYITGQYESYYQKNILLDMAILLDGKYRENMLEAGVYNDIEKYVRTSGNGPDGLYLYNFSIRNNFKFSKFKQFKKNFYIYSIIFLYFR